MSGPGVGFEYPSVPVSWYKRDVLLFANAIGCDAKDELHFLYVCVLIIFYYQEVHNTEALNRNSTQSSAHSLPTRSFCHSKGPLLRSSTFTLLRTPNVLPFQMYQSLTVARWFMESNRLLSLSLCHRLVKAVTLR